MNPAQWLAALRGDDDLTLAWKRRKIQAGAEKISGLTPHASPDSGTRLKHGLIALGRELFFRQVLFQFFFAVLPLTAERGGSCQVRVRNAGRRIGDEPGDGLLGSFFHLYGPGNFIYRFRSGAFWETRFQWRWGDFGIHR